MATGGRHARQWWQRPEVAVALVIAFALPLAVPALPPLADYPGHLARYRIAQGGSALLAQWFDFRWAFVPNLGVDALVTALAPVLGVERAAKLVVVAIPALTVAAMLLLARQVHGRVPAATLFALPLAFGWPLQLGFVNFCLGLALALAGLAVWLALAGRPRLRSGLGAVLAGALWLTHAFGWAAFGLWAFGADLARHRRAGAGLARATGRAALGVLPLAWPVMALFGNAGAPLDPQLWSPLLKAVGIIGMMRDHWQWLDIVSAAIVLVILYAAVRRRGGADPVLGVPAALGWLAYLLLPDKVLGGSFVDVRMAPYLTAVSLIAVRPMVTDARLALVGLAFVALRLVATSASLGQHAVAIAPELGALAHIPPGARVFALAGVPCHAANWDGDRFNHLAALAIVRRNAFVNDQWAIAGQQSLRVRYPAAGRYDRDPSELIYTDCGEPGVPALFDWHLAHFPRGAFDLVWTPGFPAMARPGLVPIWTSPRSALYRIVQ